MEKKVLVWLFEENKTTNSQEMQLVGPMDHYSGSFGTLARYVGSQKSSPMTCQSGCLSLKLRGDLAAGPETEHAMKDWNKCVSSILLQGYGGTWYR